MIKRRVLIVEDDEDLRTLFSVSLHRDGFETLEAADVRSAVRILAAQPPPDVVLLDIGLPHEDGYVLLDEVKQRTVDIPVIVVTGFSSFAHEGRCIAAGAADFFQKPINLADLRGAIDRSLRT